ncbi:Hypothetical predicted protein, partial [Scomber scombrus]
WNSSSFTCARTETGWKRRREGGTDGGEKEKKKKQFEGEGAGVVGIRFSFSRMGFFPHPADGGMKPGEKDGEREKEEGGERRGGCSRRAL